MNIQKKKIELLLQELTDLDEAGYLEVLEQVLKLMKAKHQKTTNYQPHFFSELEGLGHELWQKVDVDAYIRGERDSWK